MVLEEVKFVVIATKIVGVPGRSYSLSFTTQVNPNVKASITKAFRCMRVRRQGWGSGTTCALDRWGGDCRWSPP